MVVSECGGDCGGEYGGECRGESAEFEQILQN